MFESASGKSNNSNEVKIITAISQKHSVTMLHMFTNSTYTHFRAVNKHNS